MRRTLYASTLALVLLAALAAGAHAQTSRGRTSTAPAPTANASALPLPTSDGVLTLDVRKLFTEVVPRSLAGDAARLAQVNSDVDEFKARTGIDARQFDTLAVGSRLVKLPSGALKVDHTTAVARGTFQTEALVAAARAAAKGGLAEQTYAGKTVYVSTVNDTLKLFGIAKMHVKELAFAVLDANTLALGEPEDVRAAIDAQAGRGRADMSMLNFARGAGDFLAFAGNVPPGTLADVETGMLPAVDRAVASIRGFYGTVGSTAAGLQVLTTLRAGSADDAKQLFQTADALRQIAPGLIPSGDRGRFYRSMLDGLKLTTKGSEVQLRLDVPQSEIATLLRAL